MSLATVFNYFANSLWQIPLLAVCCWCALRLARASARVRYAAWIATLLLCVALPLRGAFQQDEGTVTVFTGDAIAIVGAGQSAPRLPFYAVAISPATMNLFAELYLALAALLLLRLIFSYAAQRRLIEQASSLSPDEATIVHALEATPDRVRLLPARSGTPMAAGIWKAKILLPAHLLAGDEDTLRAVLAHESAHLQRRDPMVNLLLRLAALPIAYHPGTVLVQRQIRHTRELLCDAKAAESMRSTHAYAQALLHLAREVFTTGNAAPRSALGLFERTSKPLLEERIMNLIAPPAPLCAGYRWLRVSAGVALFCTATAAVSLLHLTPSVAAASQPAVKAQPVAAVATDNGAPFKQITCAQRAEQNMISCAAEDAEAVSTLRSGKFRQQFTKLIDPRGTDSAAWQKEFSDLSTKMKSRDKSDAVLEVELMEMTQSMAKQDPSLRQTLRAARLQKTATPGQEEVASAAVPAALPQEGSRARVSGGVMAGQILTKVQPVYPPDAKSAHIAGSVVMHAIIGKDGAICSLEVVSGPAELRRSALEAVRQWTYEPYLLNGQPTEVETTITVNYSMG